MSTQVCYRTGSKIWKISTQELPDSFSSSFRHHLHDAINYTTFNILRYEDVSKEMNVHEASLDLSMLAGRGLSDD